MYPNIQTPDLNYDYLNDKHFVFDLVYNPRETKLLSISKNKVQISKMDTKCLAIKQTCLGIYGINN